LGNCSKLEALLLSSNLLDDVIPPKIGRLGKLREGYYVMDPEQAVEMVDENTICVAAILGSTLNGEFEDVKLINDLLDKKNKETGWVTSRATEPETESPRCLVY
jgi:hypothetical protein